MKWVVLTPGTGKRCMAGNGGHIALGFSLPRGSSGHRGEGRVAEGTHALLLPSTSLSGLVTGTDKARQEGDTPCGGTAVGTGIFAHRRCSLPTHGTGKPCQGFDLVGKGIWALSGQHHHGSEGQALGSWEMHVCAPGMARDGCHHRRLLPWPPSVFTSLASCFS